MNPAQPPAEEARPGEDEVRHAASKPESEPAAAVPEAQDDAADSAAPEGSLADEAPPPLGHATAHKEFTAPLDAAAERKREDDAEDVAATDTPYGEELKAAREHMGVRPADVAASLHLEEAVIRALEEGRQDKLPARVYVRGYVRAYANLLGLDPERLTGNFDSAQGAPEAATPPVGGGAGKVSRAHLSQRRAGLFLGAIVAAIVVALALTLWGVWRAFDWSFVTDPGGDGSAAPTWRSEQPQRVQREAPTTDAARTQSATAEKAPAVTDASPTAHDDDASTAQASPVARLVFTFKENSWVEVSDRTEKVYANLGKAGQSVSVSGRPPFTIAIGYAAGVELRYQGEVIALTPHTHGGVANLVVH